MVVDPALWTRHRPVPSLRVKGQRLLVDSAGAEGAVVLTRDPEDLGVATLQSPEGAAVRGGRGDEVVQEEVEGEDGAGEAEDAQHQTLEPGEAANIVQNLVEPHGEEVEAEICLDSLCLCC